MTGDSITKVVPVIWESVFARNASSSLADEPASVAAGENGTNNKVLIEWDDWDLALWTPEQRLILEAGIAPHEVYIAFGVVLSLIVVFGIAANATILYVFSRFKRLRTPANVFIINLTACDFMACLFHPFAVYSAFRGRWSFGRLGCNLYGMGVAFFGLNSIITLSAIACERYIVITSSSCRPVVAKWRITRRQAQKVCIGIWLHCAALVTPPWLFDWSHYQPEGVLVTCSWDYTSRTLSNRLYYIYLLVLGFVIPVGVLTFCYSAIFRFIVRSSREMTRLIMTSDGRMSMSKTTISFRQRRRQTDIRTALIILSLAVACFTAWTPYAIVSLIGQFAPVDDADDGKMRFSPLTTSVPAFLAKTAIVFDPIVYGFSHPQFRSSVKQILNQYSVESSGQNGPLRPGQQTTMMMISRAHPPGASVRSVRYSSVGGQGSSFISRSRPSAGQVTPSPQFKLETPIDAIGSIAGRLPHRRGGSINSKLAYRRKSSVGTAGSRRRLGSGSSSGTCGRRGSLSHSASMMAEESSTSLRLMMLHEEGEFYLFRQQHSQAGKEQRAAKRERMIQLLSMRHPLCTPAGSANQRRRASEPDLLRCSDRVIANATVLSWDDYRRKRSDYLRSVFFRSAGNLPNAASQTDSIIEGNLPILPVRDKSPGAGSTTLGIPADHYQVVNSRLNLRVQQIEQQHVKTSPTSSSSPPSIGSSSRAGHSVASTTSCSSSNYLYKRHKIHEDCCECAYRPLSETVTLSRRNGGHWRPCAVSGRDTLSCSLNSP